METTTIEDKINYLLENDCSQDGVDYYVNCLWDDCLPACDNVILYNRWWETEVNNYL